MNDSRSSRGGVFRFSPLFLSLPAPDKFRGGGDDAGELQFVMEITVLTFVMNDLNKSRYFNGICSSYGIWVTPFLHIMTN